MENDPKQPDPQPLPGEVIVLRPGVRPVAEAALEVPGHDAPRGGAARFLDGALVRLAAARDALPAWTATLLQQLERSRGYLALGRSSLRDYAREELGLTGSRLRDLRHLGLGFERFPALREAMLDGRLTGAEARRLLRVLRSDEEVAGWVARLQDSSRREWGEGIDAEARARAEGAPGGDPSEDEPLATLSIAVSPPVASKWHTALNLARELEGPGVTAFDLAEMVAAEWLSRWSEAADASEDPERSLARGGPGTRAERREVHELWKRLETATRRWAFLSWERPPARLEPGGEARLSTPAAHPHEIHERLLYLLRLQQQLDWQTGRVLSTFRRLRLHRLLLFASFVHYVSERLGMSPRRALYLADLDRRLAGWPELEAGYRTGEITWHQAWQLTRQGIAAPARRAWLARARAVSALRLEEDVDWLVRMSGPGSRVLWPPVDPDGTEAEQPPAEPDAPAPAGGEPRVRIAFRGPESGIRVVRQALDSVPRLLGDASFDTGRSLEVLLDHFLEVHDNELTRRMRLDHPILERDGWRCRMPGCTSSRQGLHVHHVRYRSRGGGDEADNLLAACWVCHKLVIHAGHARIRTDAAGDLVFELGTRCGHRPLSRWVGERRHEHRRRPVLPLKAVPVYLPGPRACVLARLPGSRVS